MKKGNALVVLGIFVMAIAVILLVEGSILGERTSEIAALAGIAAILMIGFGSRWRKGKGLF